MRRLLLALSFIILLPTVAFGVADEYYVTTTGAGDKSGTEWAKAFSLTEWEADVEGSAEAGDVYYVEDGTYTLTNAFLTALDGTAVAPIKIIGVASGTTNEPPLYSDWAFGGDRLIIAAGANDFTFDNYWMIYNIEVTTTSATGLRVDYSGNIWNCKSTNSSGSTARDAFSFNDNTGRAEKCEGVSTNGNGFDCGGSTNMRILDSYAHDCGDSGFDLANAQMVLINSIADTCTVEGVLLTSGDRSLIKNNTIYNCAIGIHATDSNSNIITNNIFDECTVPADWATEQLNNFFDYNSWDGDAGSNTGITEGHNSIDSDIDLNNPGAGDFTVKSASAVIDAGMKLTTNDGVATDHKFNIGADQDDVAAGGAGTGSISVSTNF